MNDFRLIEQEKIRLGTHGENYGSWMSTPVFFMIGGGALLALALAVGVLCLAACCCACGALWHCVCGADGTFWALSLDPSSVCG